MNLTHKVFTLAASALLVTPIFAQEVIRESVPATGAVRVTGAAADQIGGTVVQFGDGTIALRGEADSGPVQYHFSTTTQWVDDAGNMVSRETVRAGAPVTLFYAKSPEGLVVSKVVVRRTTTTTTPGAVVERTGPAAATATTTTTTTSTATPPYGGAAVEGAGTITTFGENFISVRNGAGNPPVEYRFSDTTKWVDEEGNVLTRDRVPKNAAVSFTYFQTPDAQVVSKVVVRKQVVERTVGTPPTAVRTQETIVEKPAVRVEERPRKETVVEERPAPKPERRKVVVEKPAPKPVVVEKPAEEIVTDKKVTTTTTRDETKKERHEREEREEKAREREKDRAEEERDREKDRKDKEKDKD